MSDLSHKSSEKSEMSDLATVDGASAAMRDLFPTGSVGERIRDAALSLRWSYTRTRDLWYAQSRQILAIETDRLRSLHAERTGQKLKELSDERAELDARLARMEAMLASLIEAMASGQAAEAQSLAVRIGGSMGAGTDRPLP